ncbi:hypothetical protein DFH06DRAFT_1368124 [Mycena polygramma]|nr:hypothetical protein DFH06DRAFT_1368124 [Mycena polygramma]
MACCTATAVDRQSSPYGRKHTAAYGERTTSRQAVGVPVLNELGCAPAPLWKWSRIRYGADPYHATIVSTTQLELRPSIYPTAIPTNPPIRKHPHLKSEPTPNGSETDLVVMDPHACSALVILKSAAKRPGTPRALASHEMKIARRIFNSKMRNNGIAAVTAPLRQYIREFGKIILIRNLAATLDRNVNHCKIAISFAAGCNKPP